MIFNDFAAEYLEARAVQEIAELFLGQHLGDKASRWLDAIAGGAVIQDPDRGASAIEALQSMKI